MITIRNRSLLVLSDLNFNSITGSNFYIKIVVVTNQLRFNSKPINKSLSLLKISMYGEE